MDLQIQELRNSIMEEVILKNYKLLQFVENEMKQLKEENAHLKEENKLTYDKIETLQTKIETLQTKIDNSGIEYNILVGYTGLNNPVYCNYNFNKEFKSLPYFLLNCNCKILLKLSVFKQLSTYYNFDCVDLDHLFRNNEGHKIPSINFVDGNDIYHQQKLKISTPKPIIITSCYVHNGQHSNGNTYTFPLLDKLINILNECNIKLTLVNKYELYLDETNKINYRLITNSMINDFQGMNTGRINETSNNFYISIEQ